MSIYYMYFCDGKCITNTHTKCSLCVCVCVCVCIDQAWFWQIDKLSFTKPAKPECQQSTQLLILTIRHLG